jgi:hypothetical protein
MIMASCDPATSRDPSPNFVELGPEVPSSLLPRTAGSRLASSILGQTLGKDLAVPVGNSERIGMREHAARRRR